MIFSSKPSKRFCPLAISAVKKAGCGESAGRGTDPSPLLDGSSPTALERHTALPWRRAILHIDHHIIDVTRADQTRHIKTCGSQQRRQVLPMPVVKPPAEEFQNARAGVGPKYSRSALHGRGDLTQPGGEMFGLDNLLQLGQTETLLRRLACEARKIVENSDRRDDMVLCLLHRARRRWFNKKVFRSDGDATRGFRGRDIVSGGTQFRQQSLGFINFDLSRSVIRTVIRAGS